MERSSERMWARNILPRINTRWPDLAGPRAAADRRALLKLVGALLETRRRSASK